MGGSESHVAEATHPPLGLHPEEVLVVEALWLKLLASLRALHACFALL